MDEIDFGEIQQVIDEVLGGSLDFHQMVQEGLESGTLLSWKNMILQMEHIFLEELVSQRQMWVHILILALTASVLIHFADVFQNKSVSQISFCLVYMLLFLLLITSFQNSLGIVQRVVEHLREFMTVLAPAYFLALALSSYLTSAGIYYEFILLLISGVHLFVDMFVLPGIEIYVLLTLIDHLSKKSGLSRLADLIGILVGWSLKAVLAAVMGFHMIQGLITPAVDAFRATGVSKGLEIIPGIGTVSGSVADLVLGSAVLIKNGIGAATLVVLILICLVPIVKLVVIMAAYYVLAAILQPISDERITDCLTGMGNGVKYLLQTVFTVLVLFFLSIALVTTATGVKGV